MTTTLARIARWTTTGFAAAAAGYGLYVANAWFRYGKPAKSTPAGHDDLLDRFMPAFEVSERHRIYVRAPASVTFAAAMDADLQASAIVRAIFRARELMLGARAEPRRATGLLDDVQALGWRVLAVTPGREIVVGAVTQPWRAKVVFRGLPPEEFAEFGEPDYVKIAWTLRADPISPQETIFRTETRVSTTDATARRKFRRYWARFSAGIVLIRRMLLADLRRRAEHVARTAQPAMG